MDEIRIEDFLQMDAATITRTPFEYKLGEVTLRVPVLDNGKSSQDKSVYRSNSQTGFR